MLTGRVPAKKDTSSKRVPEVTAADRLEVFSQTMRTQLSELENRSAVALRDETFLELSQRVHDISSRCDRILRQRRYLADEVAATTAAAAEEAEAEAALDSGSVRHRNAGGAEGRRMEDTARAEVAVTAGTSKQPRRKRRRRRVGSGGRLDLGERWAAGRREASSRAAEGEGSWGRRADQRPCRGDAGAPWTWRLCSREGSRLSTAPWFSKSRAR